MANLTTTSVDCRTWPAANSNTALPQPLWVVPSDLCSSYAPNPLLGPNTRVCVASPPSYMLACCLTHGGLYQETCGWTVCATNASDAEIRTCLMGVDNYATATWSLRASGPSFTFKCVSDGSRAAARAALGWGVVGVAVVALGVW